MTREEILAMQPCKAFDAIVAEKVMGWHTVELTPINNGWFWSDGKKHIAWDSFSPSTDISAAWEVVEKMKHLGYYSSHTDLSIDSLQEWWSWHFTLPHGEESTVQAISVPEAICKAALLAVMEGKDEES